MVGLFISLEEQLAKVRRWNAARGWGFSEEEFSAVNVTPTGEQSLDRVELLVPISRDTANPTDLCWVFDELSAIAAAELSASRSSSVTMEPAHLRRHPLGVEYSRGIHRVTLRLRAYHDPENGRTLAWVYEQASSAGQKLVGVEGLSAAGHFTEWVKAWNGSSVPCPDLPGLQYRFDSSDGSEAAWCRAPSLRWWPESGEFDVSAYGVRHRFYSFGAPEVLRES